MARSSGGTSRSSASAFVPKHRRIWRRREKWLPDLSRITTTRDITPVSGISHLLINCVAEHHLLLKNENASWRRQNACVPNSEPSNPLPICSLTTTRKIPLYFEPLHFAAEAGNSFKGGIAYETDNKTRNLAIFYLDTVAELDDLTIKKALIRHSLQELRRGKHRRFSTGCPQLRRLKDWQRQDR